MRPVAIQQVLDGLSGRSAQLAYDKLKQCFKWAVQMGVLCTNPLDRVQRPSHARRPIQPFTVEEVSTILREAGHLRYRAAIRLALFVGLRGGEIWGLQWGDLNGTTLTVQRQVAESGGALHVRKPKTEAGIRQIALPDSVLEDVRQHRATLMAEGNAACDWMFPTSKGNPTSRSNFSHRHWNPLLEACGLEKRGFHHCRHTAATLMLNAGVPITVVSRMLGHKDPSVTLGTYSHFMTTEMERHRNAFDQILRAS